MTADDHELIARYVAEVAKSWTPRGRLRRRAALRQLREALNEAAEDVGAAEAVRSFGPAVDTARRLDRESADGPGPRFLGVPLGIDPTSIGERARAAMDPNGPLFVPRTFGVGWDLNFGRLLTALKLVRPDDLDEDVADAIPRSRWRAVTAAVAAPYAAAVAVAAVGVRHMDEAPIHWPLFGPADAWGAPKAAFGPAISIGAVGVAAAVVAQWSSLRSSTPLNRLGLTRERAGARLNRVGSSLRSSTLNRLGLTSELAGARLNRMSLSTRLSCVSTGATLVGICLTNVVMARWFGRRSGNWALAGVAAGMAGGVLASGSLVRAGRDRVRTEPIQHREEPDADEH